HSRANRPRHAGAGCHRPAARRACPLLNDVAAQVLHAGALTPGTRAALEEGPLIEIVEVAVPTAHLAIAVELYGRRVRALQVVHAGDRGRWPSERNYHKVREGQPVLRVRASEVTEAGKPVRQSQPRLSCALRDRSGGRA